MGPSILILFFHFSRRKERPMRHGIAHGMNVSERTYVPGVKRFQERPFVARRGRCQFMPRGVAEDSGVLRSLSFDSECFGARFHPYIGPVKLDNNEKRWMIWFRKNSSGDQREMWLVEEGSHRTESVFSAFGPRSMKISNLQFPM